MHTTTNQITTNGTNTMQVNIYSDNDTHVQHSNTQRIPSLYDDENHIIDTLETIHLPNPTEYRSSVAVMFDFLNHIVDSWVHCPNTQYLIDHARNELVRGGRTPFYHECIRELVKLYNAPQGGE